MSCIFACFFEVFALCGDASCVLFLVGLSKFTCSPFPLHILFPPLILSNLINCFLCPPLFSYLFLLYSFLFFILPQLNYLIFSNSTSLFLILFIFHISSLILSKSSCFSSFASFSGCSCSLLTSFQGHHFFSPLLFLLSASIIFLLDLSCVNIQSTLHCLHGHTGKRIS